MNIVKKEVHQRLNTNLEDDFLCFVELLLSSWSPCSPSWPPKCAWWQRSCSTASVVMLPPSHCTVLSTWSWSGSGRSLQSGWLASPQWSHLRYTEHSYLTIARTGAVCGYRCLLSSTLQVVLGVIHLLLIVANISLLGVLLGDRFHNVSNLGKAFSCPCNF